MAERPRWQLKRSDGEAPFPIDEEVVVGRGKQAQLRIEEPHLSRRHARLWQEGDRLMVEDLGSSNGTFLNDRVLARPTRLVSGDRLRFDETEFQVEPAPVLKGANLIASLPRSPGATAKSRPARREAGAGDEATQLMPRIDARKAQLSDTPETTAPTENDFDLEGHSEK